MNLICANQFFSTGVQDDDNQDQIGSSGTPSPGISTPQPDPSDKRQPSIMHTYLSQVGGSSGYTPSTRKARSSISLTPASVESIQLNAQLAQMVQRTEGDVSGGNTLPSVPPVMAERDQLFDAKPSTLPDGGQQQQSAKEEPPEISRPTSLPTPPLSSSCSFLQKDHEDVEGRGPSPDKGLNSVYSTLKGYLSSSNGSSEPLSRGPTCQPMSNISDDPVLATHFASPSPHDPSEIDMDVPLLEHERPHISKTSENHAKLIENAANESRLKNTPPLTPRANSNENEQSQKQTEIPTSVPSDQQAVDTTDPSEELTDKLNDAFPSPDSASQDDGPPVGSIKGKLHVKIAEARGLRPSTDPYVVCVFEWNEYISKGAQSPDDEETKKAQKEAEHDAGRPMAIPMKSRQSSNNSSLDSHERGRTQVTDPRWNHEAVFDVLGEQSSIDVCVYDRYNQEAFLGHVRLSLDLKEDKSRLEGWFPLVVRAAGNTHTSGEIHLEMHFEKTERKSVGPNDFQILKLIGKGTFGQVYQVMKKDTKRIYAMKVLSKKVIIQKKEVAHTLGERNILVRTAMAASPFIVGLKFSFQTPTDLYLVTDYMSGGELFWHLQKEGRFAEPRAKFYIAELILALQHLHQHDIVYRDLKPENILLDANGHIALCDFGLSKANLTKNDTTNTFCGTTEYLAPEVLLDEQGYTKMVDFWSLGVLVFEMCCGWSPFYAEDTQQMYKNIAFGKVRFPRDALSAEGRNFVKGLLNRNPKHRLGAKDDAKELMAHPFFHDVDWEALNRKDVVPPFKPKLKSDTDTSNFDPEFTTALENSNSLNDRAAALANGFMPAGTPLSPGLQANFKGFTFVNESSIDHHVKTPNERIEEYFRDEDWQRQAGGSGDHRRVSDRHMSGVVKSGDDAGIFNVDV
ncbi:hypothetical protein AN4238.2 [Paecilomyces variotii No. 5]|uniref:non-specific serine/threonine protein kinase n=1 Tax=Byssochlamys spectabilis (strain No. 5 / NBRC 109023) TaxID=1356009 RepID=V5HXP8_BYSSN|nr:hypothetical protein AN4238.2 [Paecilomyces variotii No. 5]